LRFLKNTGSKFSIKKFELVYIDKESVKIRNSKAKALKNYNGQYNSTNKKAGKHFEIMVNLDDALKFRKGTSSFIQAETEFIFMT